MEQYVRCKRLLYKAGHQQSFSFLVLPLHERSVIDPYSKHREVIVRIRPLRFLDTDSSMFLTEPSLPSRVPLYRYECRDVGQAEASSQSDRSPCVHQTKATVVLSA